MELKDTAALKEQIHIYRNNIIKTQERVYACHVKKLLFRISVKINIRQNDCRFHCVIFAFPCANKTYHSVIRRVSR